MRASQVITFAVLASITVEALSIPHIDRSVVPEFEHPHIDRSDIVPEYEHEGLWKRKGGGSGGGKSRNVDDTKTREGGGNMKFAPATSAGSLPRSSNEEGFEDHGNDIISAEKLKASVELTQKPPPSFYESVNYDLTATAVRPQTNFVGEQITKKFQRAAVTLADFVVTAIAIPVTLYGAFRLRELGLLGSGVAAAAIFAQIQSDNRTSWVLELTTGAAFGFFYIGYCARRTTSLRYGEGYIAVTIILAGLTAIVLLQVPALATTWNKCTGMINVEVLLLIHLVTVFLTSASVKAWRLRQKKVDNLSLHRRQNPEIQPGANV